MPQITVDAKKQFLDNIYATFLFIETVTAGLGVYVRVFYDGGRHEDQEIVSGSKFLQGENGEKIEKLMFINPSVLSADIEYRFSTVFGYDEARLIGDVNALTRSANLSLDGNQFISGFNVNANVANFGAVAFYNPAGSGIDSNVNVSRLNAYGDVLNVLTITEAQWLTSYTQLLKVPNKIVGDPDGLTNLGYRINAAKIGSTYFSMSSDLYGTPVANDFGNAPIVLKEGRGVVFTTTNVNTPITCVAEISEEVAV